MDKIPQPEDDPPAGLRSALLPEVPSIVEASIAEIRRKGEPGGPSWRALEKNLRVGLTDACERWFRNGTDAAGAELHFALGRAQARAGRSLDELLRFYRIAGQTAWRRVTEVGAAKKIAPEDLYRLVETGLGYVDDLSIQAAAGYGDEHSRHSSISHLRRSELARLLLRDPQPDREAIEDAAQAVGIELGPTLAFFVGAAELYDSFTRAGRERFVLPPREATFVGAVFDPDIPARRARLKAVAERARVQLALGPPVPLAKARGSLRRAKALFNLMCQGLVIGAPLVLAESHDVPLLLSAEPELAQQVARRRLAPLDAVRGDATRRNLAETLDAWLRHQGQRKPVAHALGVHPQTVQYRLGQLRDLFGSALDHPDERFELELALRLRPYRSLLEGGD
jgi:PucR C-terminal helix-turn-helix domain